MRGAEARRSAEKGGRRAEGWAAFWLMLKGHSVIGRRVRTPVGELDMVTVSPGGIVCFIEVKARKRAEEALDAILPQQRARIARAAEYYLSSRANLRERHVRFDVMLVVPFRAPRHIKDAWRL